MKSKFESFFESERFAVVGRDTARPFPRLTFRGLLQQGKIAFPVDPSIGDVDGEKTYPDLASLPESVEAVVLEVPPKETAHWVRAAAEAGVRNVWLHMKTETPEALALGKELGMDLCFGTCAVQYVDSSFPHSVHKALRKLQGNW